MRLVFIFNHFKVGKSSAQRKEKNLRGNIFFIYTPIQKNKKNNLHVLYQGEKYFSSQKQLKVANFKIIIHRQCTILEYLIQINTSPQYEKPYQAVSIL